MRGIKMNNATIKNLVVSILSTVGILFLVLANLTGIGIFLYQWGAIGLGIGAAAWLSFKFWISMLIIGFLPILAAFGLE
jgi:hypothetical protein